MYNKKKVLLCLSKRYKIQIFYIHLFGNVISGFKANRTMEIRRARSSFRSMNSERKLESIFLSVTGKCNARCTMYFYTNNIAKKERDLTFEEIRKVSETAGKIDELWVSGGEPTLGEDLPEIFEVFYQNNRIKDINMPTSGLKPNRVIEWIKHFHTNCLKCDIDVSISLDGFGEARDIQRGVPGNFYKAVDMIREVNEHFRNDGKVLLNMATVITKYNINRINDFMAWIYGRFHLSTHTIEATHGVTRENGVKTLDESTLRLIQDEATPVYGAYAERMVANTSGLREPVTKFFYTGIVRALYNTRASNIDRPTQQGVDCAAGEAALVIDYDGHFRSCELREPLGNVKDCDCNVQHIVQSDVMKKEVGAIGHGYKANCWYVHGCFITVSLIFDPRKMIKQVCKGYREVSKLDKPIGISKASLIKMEDTYHLSKEELQELGIAAY